MDGARLLLVDDDDVFRAVMTREVARAGHTVEAVGTGAAALRALEAGDAEVVLLDLRLPDMDGLEVLERVRRDRPGVEVIVLTAHGAVDTAIRAVRLGAYDYLEKPVAVAALDVAIRKAKERRTLLERNVILSEGLKPPEVGRHLVGASPAFQGLMQVVDRVAQIDSTVLVLGETGVGKEAVAKLLHAHSPRRERPFVVVDCGALHDSLLQSELFGHEKGAYTGADRLEHGLFEVADGGTIFLDEIGDISAVTQAQLLRVLETSSFRRVGGTRELRVDVRVVAATNRDLQGLMDAGTFRRDLYYRLHAIEITVPPLRDRSGDVALLLEHFARRFNASFQQHKRFSDRAARLMEAYRWPGNVRELMHTVETLVLLTPGDEIEAAALPAAIRGYSQAEWLAEDAALLPLREMERRYVELAMRRLGGHRARVAEALGISERNLYRKLNEFGLG